MDLHGDRLSRRSVTKPEAASEARREIARNAPPSVVFYETAVKNNKKIHGVYSKCSREALLSSLISFIL